MATQRNEIVTVLSIDARDLEAKTASISANIDKLEGKIVELTNGVQGYSTQVDNAAKVTARQASSLESLLTSVDPVYAAHKKLADEQARVENGMKTLSNQFAAGQRSAEGVSSATAVLSAKSKELTDIQNQLRAGHISAEEALDKVRQTMTTAADASKALGGAFKLSYENQQVLRSGVINTFQSISAGLPIGQTLLTQTTQTAPAFAEMAKNAGLSTTAMVAFGVPAALAAATVGAIALKLVQASSEMRAFTTALKAGSQQAQVTAADLESMVASLSHNGVARSDAVAILSTVSSVQQSLSKSQISQIADLAPDMATKFGDAGEAFKKAVSYLTEGIPGIRQAYQETGALSLAQYEAAKAAFEHGNRAQALQIVLDGLKTKFAGLHQESLSPTQRAMEGLKTAYDDLATTAANHPITIKIITEGADTLKGLADFIQNPSLENWSKFAKGGGGVFGLAGRASGYAAGELARSPSLSDFLRDPFNTPFPTFGIGEFFGGAPGPLNRNPRGPSEGALTGAGRGAASYPSAPSGTPIPGVKPATVDGMTPNELGQLSDLRDANDKLAKAMQKVGAERQVAVAGVQAYIAAINAKKSKDAAEQDQLEAERMARVQLSAAIADQTAQITIQARESLNMADAYMQSSAAGERAAAMRQAQLDSLQSGIDVETRYQQILNERAATQAATSAQALQTYQQEVAGREAVANATMEGVDAAYKAEMAEKVRIGTLAETIALENASGEAAEKLRKIIEAKTAAILDDERAQKKQQVAQAIQQQKDQIALGQAQLRLMGASAEERAVEIAKLQAMIYLRNQHIDALSAEGQAYIANAENIARQQLETERLQAAYQELERFGDQAFSSVIDAVVKGGEGTKTWANAVKGLATELQTLALKMAVLNPVKNFLFGSNLPTIFDFGSIVGSSGQSGAAGQGGAMSLGNAASLASAANSAGLFGNTFSGIGSSVSGWLNGSLGSSLGFASGAQIAAPSAAFVGPMPLEAGSLFGTTTFTQFLGGAGLGMGVGSLLNSLVGGHQVGGTIGSGVGSLAGAAIGSIIPGIGTLIGGLIGGAGGGLLGGLIGPHPTVGKTASSDVTINAGGKTATFGNILTDNEGDPAAGKALGQYISSLFTTAAAGGGTLAKNFGFGQTEKDGYYIGGSVPYQKFGDDFGAMIRHALIDQGGLVNGGTNTLAAIKNSKNKDADEFAKDLSLGASIDAGNTALKQFDKTLGGITRSAKETTADSLKPMLEEFERAKKLDIGDAYKGLASDRLKSYLDLLKSPVEWTATEQAVASATGQFQAMREAFAQLDPAIVSTIDAIEKETKARLAFDLSKDLDNKAREAGGRGYINSINTFVTDLEANSRSLLAVGEPVARAQELFNQSMVGLLKTLTVDQLNDVVRQFGGNIADMANIVKWATDNTNFKDLFKQLSIDNVNDAIDALKEQESAAKDTKTAWEKVQKSAADARAAMLTGDLSKLSPEQKLTEALKQYDDLVVKAKAGDADAGDAAVNMKDAVLKVARDYYASSEDYAKIFDHVRDGLDGVESTASKQLRIANDGVKTGQDQLTTLKDILKTLQQPPQADINAVLGGLNASNYGAIAQWAERQGPAVMQQVLSAADYKLGWQNNPLRYTASSDIASLNIPTDAWLGILHSIGYAGNGNPSEINSWIAAYHKKDEYENAMRSYAKSAGIPGFEAGGIVGNGMWGRDSVLAQYAGGGMIALAGGEGVLTARATASIGSGAVDYINRTGMLPANDRWGGNVMPYPAARSSGGGAAVDFKGVERRLDDAVDLLKALVYENSELKTVNKKQAAELSKLRTEAADRDARPRRTGTYGQ